jgi:hypothetical protein
MDVNLMSGPDIKVVGNGVCGAVAGRVPAATAGATATTAASTATGVDVFRGEL